ncbi:hypothetical protein CEXT_738331 [Caerostris extrusa]|uniref:Uncharacterized protein n=1 Tax=Caerostris extrusa TaxID=172846 RepID=A0AAV4VQM0_CAEEX|nr:hypothetical protein CEXT_738331 [Caerostris extrusa]
MLDKQESHNWNGIFHYLNEKFDDTVFFPINRRPRAFTTVHAFDGSCGPYRDGPISSQSRFDFSFLTPVAPLLQGNYLIGLIEI